MQSVMEDETLNMTYKSTKQTTTNDYFIRQKPHVCLI